MKTSAFHSTVWPAEWHASLERYGAGELNERYARRFGRRMSSTAWCGWAATKAVVEAALRARIPISVCGEIAGDPRYTALLLGRGVRELSMAWPAHMPRAPVAIVSTSSRPGSRRPPGRWR